MEVILKEDVQSLGKAGDVVKVRDGFARNFLFPHGKAALADPKNLKELEHYKRVVAAKQVKLKKGALELASRIAALSLTIKKEAGEEDKLFGAVTTKDIADNLRQENILIDKRQIQLEAPIKRIGVYDISIKLHTEVTATLKVWVVKA